MKIGGHTLREHFHLLVPLFVFIAIVWVVRLAIGMMDVMHPLLHVVSVTGGLVISLLFAAVLIHVKDFGSYPNVVMSILLLVAWSQVLIIAAIIFSVATGMENIYTAPEFSRMPVEDPHHIKHIIGHLTFVLGGVTLFGSAVGCVVLWMLRRMVPEPRHT